MEIPAMMDEIVGRVRKVEGTLRSVGDIACHQTLEENNAPYLAPRVGLAELCEYTSASLHQRADPGSRNKHKGVASIGLLDSFIDKAKKPVISLRNQRSGEPTWR